MLERNMNSVQRVLGSEMKGRVEVYVYDLIRYLRVESEFQNTLLGRFSFGDEMLSISVSISISICAENKNLFLKLCAFIISV